MPSGAVTTGLNESMTLACQRLVGEVEHGLRRVERLEQRAGIVAEDVGHLAGREPGLDEVVAIGAAGARLDLDLDVGIGGLEAGLHVLGDLHVEREVVDEVGERHVLGERRRKGRRQCKAGGGCEQHRAWWS